MKRTRLIIIAFLLLSVLCGCSMSSADQIVSTALSGQETPPPTETPYPEEDDEEELAVEDISVPEETDILDGVVLGRGAFYHASGVVFWGADGYFCSALTDSSGGMYDFIIEGELSTTIWSVAISGDDCFLATSAGFLQFSLTDFEQGSADLLIVNKDVLLEGFSVYDGTIYYQDGSQLMWFSMTDTEPQQLLSGVEDHVVTNQGIYYTDEDGGLFLKGFDGSQRELLLDTPEHTRFTIVGQTVYYWTADGSVYVWEGAGEEPGYMELTARRDPDTDIWVTNEYLIYTDIDEEVYRYDLYSGEETHLDGLYLLPDKDEGFLNGDILYYRYADAVYWSDLIAGERVRTDIEDFAGSVVSTPQPEDEYTQSYSGSFNMANGLGILTRQGYTALYNDYFSLELPALPIWDYELIDENAIKLYYCAGRDAGYDGTFLTIRAYDWGDNSYADLPSYSMAGMDSEKKYVAIFPTDVRYDPSDPTQADEFMILFEAVQEIDSNNNPTGNPFTVKNP